MSRKIIQDYFNFSKKELNGILILLIILLFVILFPFIYQPEPIANPLDLAKFKKEVAEFEKSSIPERAYSYREVKTHEEEKLKVPVYFNFDPNGLSEENWKKLGLSEKQIKVLKHYEAKGGKFYHKEDVQKMYVISPQLYHNLEPYIQIDLAKLKPDAQPGINQPAPVFVDINLADSTQLQTIKGIGPAFASRIVRYRDRLGGFYQLDQLREVYGVDSVHFEQWRPQIRLSNPVLKKININTALFDDLKRHPYLNYKQINAIIQYRKQHGLFRDKDDLRQISLLNDEILRKLEPYLKFQ